MITHLRHPEIDKAWWDAQLLRCANRIWYAQSWALDIASPGWDALIDEKSGAIMPLTWRRKWGIDYLFQPFGLQQLGVFAPHVDDALCTAFLNAIPVRYRYWDICLNDAMRVVDPPNTVRTVMTDQVLRLDKDATVLRAGYSEGHRRNLRKGPDPDGIESIALGPDEFVRAFERTTADRFGGLKVADRAVLTALLRSGIERGQCSMVAQRVNGALHAAQVVVRWEGRMILLKSAVTEEGIQARTMFGLIDGLIAANAGSDQLLDFAGSNTLSVARFYSGFGAQPRVYLRLVRNRLPAPLRWLKR